MSQKSSATQSLQISPQVLTADTQARLGLKPKQLIADTAYGTGKFLAYVVASKIAPHIPVWENSQRAEGTFSREDFTFDRQRNVYICPAGKTLTTTGNVGRDHVIRYLGGA